MNSDAAISTDPVVATGALAGWVAATLQAADSFYPTGGYAHSFGLEGLVQQDVVRDRESLREFLRLAARPALARTDLPLVAHAWRAFHGPDWHAILRLLELSSALKAPAELRRASESIGRQRAELLALLRPDSLAPEFVTRAGAARAPHSAAVSAALEALVHGAPLEAALAGYAYSTLAGVIAAAMKLLRLGQNAAQALLAEALAALPELIRTALAIPEHEIGWFNPWLDIASARHEAADARMFIS